MWDLNNLYVLTISVSTVLAYFIIVYKRNKLRKIVTNREAVFITGCDSGIGLYFAKHLASMGFIVFAGVLDPRGPGVDEMLESNNSSAGQIFIYCLDVTDDASIDCCLMKAKLDIEMRELELVAVINNAGVMVFGEFEWQTFEHITKQVNVNLIGYMKIAKKFLPLLHRFNGRLLNVSSHCSLVPLPCLSVYSATKCAIEAWSSALSLELHKFNIPVITLLPGSYVQQSAILKNHPVHKDEMLREMTSEQRSLYEPYFIPVMDYMSAIYKPGPINDPQLLSILRSAILSEKPKRTYSHSPWRYALYQTLIAIAGPYHSLRRFLILSYVSLPDYK